MCYFRYVVQKDNFGQYCDIKAGYNKKAMFLWQIFIYYYRDYAKNEIKLSKGYRGNADIDPTEKEIKTPEELLHEFLVSNNNDQENSEIITFLAKSFKKDPYLAGAKFFGIDYFKQEKKKLQEKLKDLKKHEKMFSIMPHSSYKKAYLSGVIGRVKRINWIIKKLGRV